MSEENLTGTAFTTPDLSDEHPAAVALIASWRNFGGHKAFHGAAITVKCFEDNSLIKSLAGEPGLGRVIVVDGGESPRRALLGDQIAANAASNGWAGLVIAGAVRDVEVLRTLSLGVKALFSCPQKTEKRGEGQQNIAVQLAGVTVLPGDHIYADENGVLVSSQALV
ncbi:MAG: ribonuclease E activity regulator RraA [Pseudomonadota bacterium]